MTDLKFVVDYTDLQLLDRKLVDIEKTAKSSASVFEREYNKAERQLKKTTIANQNFFNSLLGVGNQYNKASASASVFEKQLIKNEQAMAREERRVENLKQKYNPMYAALKQYEQALDEINEAYAVGAINSTRMSAAVEALDQDFTAFKNGTAGWSNQFVQSSNRAGKSLNKFGAYSQQFGYQFSDFIVQVQGGTSAFVAFGQQGAQLFGLISGPWGAALSIGAAAIGAFGAAWMRSKDQMEEAETGAKALEDRIVSINKAVETYFRNQEALQKGITPEEQDLSTQIEQAEKARDEAQKIIDDIDKMLQNATATGAGGAGVAILRMFKQDDLDEAMAAVAKAEENIAQLRKKQEAELAQERLEAGIDGLEAYLNAYVEGHREAGEIVADIVEENYEREKKAAEDLQALRFASGQAISDQLVADTMELEAQYLKAKDMANEILEAYNKGEDLSKLNLTGTITNWSDAAAILATKLGDAAAAARIIDAVGFFGMTTGTGLVPGGDFTPPKSNIKNYYGKSSGGSKGETQEEYLAKLQREIDLKRDSIGVFGEERKIMEEVARLKEQVIKKDYDISEKKLEQIVREEAELDRQLKNQQDMYDTFHSIISNAMMDLVTGSASVEDAFKQMLYNIIAEIYKQRVVEPVANIGSQLLGSIFGSAKGNVFSGGSPVKAFASGGVVNSPTMFPMRGNQTGLMGEAGAEAIMPLKRTANGDLGVQVAGGQMQKSEVVISLSPELIAQVLSQAEGNSIRVVQQAAGGIVKASVNAVTNERRKGGTMKAAFG